MAREIELERENSELRRANEILNTHLIQQTRHIVDLLDDLPAGIQHFIAAICQLLISNKFPAASVKAPSLFIPLTKSFMLPAFFTKSAMSSLYCRFFTIPKTGSIPILFRPNSPTPQLQLRFQFE